MRRKASNRFLALCVHPSTPPPRSCPLTGYIWLCSTSARARKVRSHFPRAPSATHRLSSWCLPSHAPVLAADPGPCLRHIGSPRGCEEGTSPLLRPGGCRRALLRPPPPVQHPRCWLREGRSERLISELSQPRPPPALSAVPGRAPANDMQRRAPYRPRAASAGREIGRRTLLPSQDNPPISAV